MEEFDNKVILEKLKNSLAEVGKIEEYRNSKWRSRLMQKIVSCGILLGAAIVVFPKLNINKGESSLFIFSLGIVVVALLGACGWSISAEVDEHYKKTEKRDLAYDNIFLEAFDFLPDDCLTVAAVNYLIKELENNSSYKDAIIKYRKEVL